MAISGTITLLTASTNMSTFDLYSCTSSNGASCSGTSFETNITRNQLLNGFVSNSSSSSFVIIGVKRNGDSEEIMENENFQKRNSFL